MKTKRYFWQPELSLTIIYWSVTLFILFFSLILTLEKTHPYVKSNLIMIGFAVLVFLGFHRFFTITEKGVYLHPIYIKKKLLAKESFQSITVEKHGIKIQLKSGKTRSFLMQKKQKNRFVTDLSQTLPEILIKKKDEQ